MKYIYLLFILLPVLGTSQVTFPSVSPFKIGDTLISTAYSGITAYKPPSGTNQTYNFSLAGFSSSTSNAFITSSNRVNNIAAFARADFLESRPNGPDTTFQVYIDSTDGLYTIGSLTINTSFLDTSISDEPRLYFPYNLNTPNSRELITSSNDTSTFVTPGGTFVTQIKRSRTIRSLVNEGYGVLDIDGNTSNTILLKDSTITIDSVFIDSTGSFVFDRVDTNGFFALPINYFYFTYQNDVVIKAIQSTPNGTAIGTYTLSLLETKRSITSSLDPSLTISSKFYPNPTSDILYFEMEDWTPEDEIRLVSVTGKTLWNYQGANVPTKADLSTVTKGVYFLVRHRGSIHGKAEILVIE